ncbi:hypothetical protein BE15_38575 [Sorangium cellulosum]|uniref:Uncharacterized protein n=1 Tax=Sorangium cellulosum TaxID=56 RepID=A0A150QGG5_SORCE|nr:hypothetical protein BE15_38575 [Sorangium cellulosum]
MSASHYTRIELRLKVEEAGRAYLDALSHANSVEEVEALRGQWRAAEKDLLDNLRGPPAPETVQERHQRMTAELVERVRNG